MCVCAVCVYVCVCVCAYIRLFSSCILPGIRVCVCAVCVYVCAYVCVCDYGVYLLEELPIRKVIV